MNSEEGAKKELAYIIREMQKTQNEQEKVMDIWLEATIAGHPFIKEAYWKSQFNTVRDRYLPRCTTYVYEDETGICGFISVIGQRYIGALFIRVDSQGKGIGTRLIQYVCKQIPLLELAVFSKNETAISFYKKNGFRIISEDIDPDTGEREYMMKQVEK